MEQSIFRKIYRELRSAMRNTRDCASHSQRFMVEIANRNDGNGIYCEAITESTKLSEKSFGYLVVARYFFVRKPFQNELPEICRWVNAARSL